MIESVTVNVPETVPTKAEKVFLGLIREGMMRYYVGRAAELSDEELRSVFALAVATIRKNDLKSFDMVKAPEATRIATTAALDAARGKSTDGKEVGIPIA
ncbi:hypothetical protein IT570_04530 [Candidatus Sumerlaeota bacterium]|nr:hypothetical protein [Candidatus Sumerlaeota bacterium]